MDKINGGTRLSVEKDSDHGDLGILDTATDEGNSKNGSGSDGISEAPRIDLHGAKIVQGDITVIKNTSPQIVTQILANRTVLVEEEQEYLEDMPILTSEVGPEAEFEAKEENVLNIQISLPRAPEISSVSKVNRISNISRQRSYDTDIPLSIGTPKFQAEKLNKVRRSIQPDGGGVDDVGVHRCISDEKQSTCNEIIEMDTADSLASTELATKERRKRKPRSELDRLLMDEGTVRILLGQPKAENSPGGCTRKDKLNELQKKRDLVINQVRDSSKTKLFNKVSLRLKTKTKRQQSEEKRNSSQKSKITTEPASKIIRRRSSSCSFNFSSRSPSPLPMSATFQSSSQDPIQVRVQNGAGYICIDSEALIFNTQIASRLNSILNSFTLDDSITVVELKTTSDFIQGLDIAGIRGETDDSLRESMADSMIACLHTLLKTLMKYPKLLVAGVQGEALNFGVLILSYFDIVYASDKATFRTNYVNNGYLPECLQFIPKNRLTHAMLYTGKKLSAAEAVISDLITEVIPASKFSEELANRIKLVLASSQQVSSTTWLSFDLV